MCPFSSSTREGLIEHVLLGCKKQQGEQFKCNECTYLTTRKANLIRHRKSKHFNEKSENRKAVSRPSNIFHELELSSFSISCESNNERQNSSETEKPRHKMSKKTTVSAKKIADEKAPMVG